MKMRSILLISSLILLLSSCEAEGLHVGHVVESSSTSDKINVKWHDVDNIHTWVNGYSSSRAYKVLKKKYSVLSDDEVLIVVGDLYNDLILKDTVISSASSYEVSMKYQDRYLNKNENLDKPKTQEEKDKENRRFAILILAISSSIFLLMTGFKITRLISDKLEIIKDKKNILMHIRHYLNQKGNTWDRDRIKDRLMRQGFDSNAIKSVLDELENEVYGNN